MSELKLEVGKSYRNRKGDIIRIVKNDNHLIFPFENEHGDSYTKSGRFLRDNQTDQDLIEEVKPEPKRRKVKWKIRGRVKRKEASEAIYYTPDEVEMIIGNPPYPAAPEYVGPLADAKASFEREADNDFFVERVVPAAWKITFDEEQFYTALRAVGLGTYAYGDIHELIVLLQQTNGNPTINQLREMGNTDD